jgi:hypothetical protein
MASGGTLDTTGTVALLSAILSLGVLFYVRINRKPRRTLSEYERGDCRLSQIINGGE